MERSDLLENYAYVRDNEAADWDSPRNRKKRRRSNRDIGNNETMERNVTNEIRGLLVGIEQSIPRIKRRVLKTAAIAIKGTTSDFSYAEAIKRARKNISIVELGIQNPRIRRAMNGVLIIEISGPDNGKKAELRTKLAELLGEEANVTRPLSER